MSLLEKVLAAGLVIVGAGVIVCLVGMWWTARRGPSTSEREAVEDAPDSCCVAMAVSGEHDVWCPRRPAVGRAVVAGSDLDPLEALYRAPAFKGVRAFRTPGERAS